MIYQAVLKTQPDGTLATLAAAGSEPAFEAIVHRYRRPLLGYCRRLRLSDNRSEDVVQQTFMNAWGSLRDGAEVRDLRPWLYRITHNQAVSMLRASGRDETSLDEFVNGSAGGFSGEEYDRTAPVEVVYERQARLRETLSAVAELPALQREALLATAVEGLSYDEVAAALNTTGDAVRGLVYRARNTLRTGVAVVSPSPLVVWAANHAGQAVSVETISGWLTEASVSGGSVGLGAATLKGAVVIASSAAVVGGTVGTGLERQVFGTSEHHVSSRHRTPSFRASAAPRSAGGHPATAGRPAATAQPLSHGGVLTASASGSGGRSATTPQTARTVTTSTPTQPSHPSATSTSTTQPAASASQPAGASGRIPVADPGDSGPQGSGASSSPSAAAARQGNLPASGASSGSTGAGTGTTGDAPTGSGGSTGSDASSASAVTSTTPTTATAAQTSTTTQTSSSPTTETSSSPMPWATPAPSASGSTSTAAAPLGLQGIGL